MDGVCRHATRGGASRKDCIAWGRSIVSGHRCGLGGRVRPENLVDLVAAQDDVTCLVGIDERGETAGVTASEFDRGFPLRGHQRTQIHEVTRRTERESGDDHATVRPAAGHDRLAEEIDDFLHRLRVRQQRSTVQLHDLDPPAATTKLARHEIPDSPGEAPPVHQDDAHSATVLKVSSWGAAVGVKHGYTPGAVDTARDAPGT